MVSHLVRLQVFSKSPDHSEVKTRLSPVLDRKQRQVLQTRLLTHTLTTCQKMAGQLQLWIYPKCNDNLTKIAREYHAELCQQSGNDLGERMLNSLNHTRVNHTRTLLLGTDCPAIDFTYLTEADALLQTFPDRLVIGPAFDGGFVLIGANRAIPPDTFCGIEWGSGRVLQQTLDRVTARGIEISLLPTLHDIDRPEDLVHLPSFLHP